MGDRNTRNQSDLTAPEYAVLIAGRRMTPSVVIRAAFVETLARGAIRLETHKWSTGTQGAVHEQRLIIAATGPVDDLGPVLKPVLDTLRSAKATHAEDGTTGVAVPEWVRRFKTRVGPARYVMHIVWPALAERGLLVIRQRKLLPGSRSVLTADGKALAKTARERLAATRTRVDEGARETWAKEPAVASATLSALGSLGALVLADPELVAALVELRGICRRDNASGGDPASMGTPEAGVDPYPRGGSDDDSFGSQLDGSQLGGSGLDGLDGSSFDGLDGGGLDGLDGLDLSDVSSFDSSFDGGGFDGGSGGSDGGGGGGGGGGD